MRGPKQLSGLAFYLWEARESRVIFRGLLNGKTEQRPAISNPAAFREDTGRFQSIWEPTSLLWGQAQRRNRHWIPQFNSESRRKQKSSWSYSTRHREQRQPYEGCHEIWQDRKRRERCTLCSLGLWRLPETMMLKRGVDYLPWKDFGQNSSKIFETLLLLSRQESRHSHVVELEHFEMTRKIENIPRSLK